jgi:hypothetical protein
MSEVSADRGDAGRKNADASAGVGATPFIAFASHHRRNGGGTSEKMYSYFSSRHTEILLYCHKRSNVESMFSMMKRKFGGGLRSKTDVAMVNETLCKVLCHLVVLIHAMDELGIDPVFWAGEAATA